MKEDPTSIAGVQQIAGLTQSEVQALFRLVIKRPLRPALTMADTVPAAEAVLILAAGLLKGYGFDSPSVLMITARMWAWLEGGEGDEDRAIILNVVDRHYVGWNCMGKHVLVNMTTGDDVTPDQELPCVLESSAYNLYELLKRRIAMVRGERTSLWEGRDATSSTARDQTAKSGDGLGEPQVLRDDVTSPLS